MFSIRGSWGLPCSKSFCSAKHRNPLVPRKTELQTHAQKFSIIPNLSFWSPRRLHKQVSILRFSLPGVGTCGLQCCHCLLQLLSLPGLGYIARLLQQVVQGAPSGTPVPKAAHAPGAKELSRPVCKESRAYVLCSTGLQHPTSPPLVRWTFSGRPAPDYASSAKQEPWLGSRLMGSHKLSTSNSNWGSGARSQEERRAPFCMCFV